MSKEMQHINEQEEDLEMEKGEYPIIDELKKQIKPYQELWDLCHEYNEKYLEAWQKGLLKDLIPDNVEADYKNMTKVANSL